MKNYQYGFTLISAIFLLVVISALGIFAVTISTSQQQTSAMDFQGSRAYQAAKAGLEWGVYQISKNNVDCTASHPMTSPTMPAGTQLSIFSVTLDCTGSSQYTEGANPFFVYQVKATAKAGSVGSADYVERQLQIQIKNP